MYITLTNATEAHKGNSIAINTSLIATVHDSLVTRENGVTERITYVFCPPHGTWEVSEPLEDLVTVLNSVKRK
jgi:hypothetical protein